MDPNSGIEGSLEIDKGDRKVDIDKCLRCNSEYIARISLEEVFTRDGGLKIYICLGCGTIFSKGKILNVGHSYYKDP